MGDRAKTGGAALVEQRHVERCEQQRQAPERHGCNRPLRQEEQEADAGEDEEPTHQGRLEWSRQPPGGDRDADHQQPERRVDRQPGRHLLIGEERGRPGGLGADGQERGDEIRQAIALADRKRRAGGEQREQDREGQGRRLERGLDPHECGERKQQQRRGVNGQAARAFEAPGAAAGGQTRREVERREDAHERKGGGVAARTSLAAAGYVGAAHPGGEHHQRRRRTQQVEQHLAAPQGNGEQPRVDAQQEPEQQRRVFAVRRRAGKEQREEQRQRAVERGCLLEPGCARFAPGVERARASGEAQRDESEERKGHEDTGGNRELGGRQEGAHPAPLVDRGKQQAEHDQCGPALPVGDPPEAGVQQQQVAEQAERVVAPRRQQGRRREAADEAEQRDEDRIPPYRQQHRHHRHQRQHRERGAGTDELPAVVGRKERREQHHDGGAVHRVRRHGVASGGLQLAARQQPRADCEANRHPHGRLQPALLHRVADEQYGRDRERDAGDPGEEPHADQLLPVKRRRSWRGARRQGGPEGLRRRWPFGRSRNNLGRSERRVGRRGGGRRGRGRRDWCRNGSLRDWLCRLPGHPAGLAGCEWRRQAASHAPRESPGGRAGSAER